MARPNKSAYDVLNDQSSETPFERWFTNGLEERSRCSVALRTRLDVALVEASHEILLGYERDGGTTGEVVLDVHANLGSVPDESLSLDSGTANGGSGTDDSGVDGARDAVLLLDVDLGEVEVLLIVSVVLLDVSAGRSINHVAHLEALDGLVLSDTPAAVNTSDDVGVALVVLSTTVVSSLRWHF